MTANAGFVSVGITSDTAEFARGVDPLLARTHGTTALSAGARTDDHGRTVAARMGRACGSWKLERQRLADETGLAIHVHPYPPGASKWNKIEHRLFCSITHNWRGRPLTDRLAVVELIGATTTNAGSRSKARSTTRRYRKGVKVSNAAMKRLAITGDQFHPEWNYTIKPRPP